MPIRTRIIPQSGLIVSVARGVIDRHDIERHRDEVVSHADYDDILSLLFDMRRVSEYRLAARELKEHARSGGDVNPRYARIAVLATSDLGFGLARMYEAHVSDQYGDGTFTVFRDKHAAWAWLTGQDATAIVPPPAKRAANDHGRYGSWGWI